MAFGLRGRLASHPLFRRLFVEALLLKTRMSPRRTHPLDRLYHIETQAHVPAYLSRAGSTADRHVIPYAGCVPSALRAVLTTLPPPERFSFVDLGCGKGRALIVASERPFRRIVGVELLPALVAAARRNAARVLGAHPGRPEITVQQGDASRPHWPDGPLVVFLYHPFGEPLIDALRTNLKAHATQETFVVYENPVHGAVFDADADFTRWFSAMIDYDQDEIGLGFDAAESVVAWRLAPGGVLPPRPGADRPIEVVLPGLRAIVG